MTQLSVASVSGRVAPLCNMLSPRQERMFSTGKVVGPRWHRATALASFRQK